MSLAAVDQARAAGLHLNLICHVHRPEYRVNGAIRWWPGTGHWYSPRDRVRGVSLEGLLAFVRGAATVENGYVRD